MAAIVLSFPYRAAGRWRSVLRTALICGLATTLAGCAWLDLKQRELVYRPTPGRPADFKGLHAGDRIFTVAVPGADPAMPQHVQMWWMPNPDPQAPTLLYLHGTFRNLYQNLRKVEALRDDGFSVVALEYRGWGGSTPIIPTEATIYADANLGWAELARRQSDPYKRVIYGHSMGTGVAVELASHRHFGTDYGGLILESSFPSLPDVARAEGVLGTIAACFATQKFDSIDKIGKVDAPILMMHGSADTTVPIALGRRLFDAAPKGTRWVVFPGGSHSDLDEVAPQAYREAVRSLIARLHPPP
ncbi:MAG: alpha/beta fold hydrolase [Burkholderiales bacterium]|nr:alpha/beta fold hydrolase [Burkholderiales bacterium]